MTTHTPGPWTHTRTDDATGHQRIEHVTAWSDDHKPRAVDAVADVYYGGSTEGKANARLISAAPTLLEACQAAKMILRQVDEIIGSGTEADVSGSGGSTVLNASEVRPALQSLRAAIAQALGQ